MQPGHTNNQSHYRTIAAHCTAEYREKGSRFIAFAFPILSVSKFKNHLEEIKKEHPKATHHCFAYRIGHNNDLFRASDDGEPSGTAGRPILGQIDSKGLTNILIIIVRYFGGTLLGVTGLINAYRSAALAVLEQSSIVSKKITQDFIVECDYTRLNEVLHVLKQEQAGITEKTIALYCRLMVNIPVERKEMILHKLHAVEGCGVKGVTEQ